MRNAKIICTLGPACDTHEAVRDLADAGMSVARLNASHGTHEDRADLIDTVQAVDDDTEQPIAAMVDLRGPEIRTAAIDEPITLETDSEVLFAEGEEATPDRVGLSVGISAGPGDVIYLDDGRVEAVVERSVEEGAVARIVSGGEIGSRTGVNSPDATFDVDLLTDADRRDLELAVRKEVDFVAASFVRDAEDVFEVAGAIEELGGEIPVIAKIERREAAENVEELVDAAYGVMVARGDLGVECPLEDVPLIQKRIVRQCRATGTPVIIATELLDSMVHARRPTRAEASDVANAVLDGADAVMLSAETAVGDHPVATVETMDRIVRQVERSEEYRELREQRVPPAGDSSADALARSARFLARDIGAEAVVAASESGYTALKVAKYRPPVPVVIATPSEEVRRRLALSWGLIPRHVSDVGKSAQQVIKSAVRTALDAKAAASGDTVVVLSGMISELEDANTTNLLKIHVAAETIVTGASVVPGRVVGPVAYTDGDLSAIPDGAILALSEGFDGEFQGDLSRIGGIVAAESGLTGYAAIVARELDVPMISGAELTPNRVARGDVVTVDAERGIVYEGDVTAETEQRT
jgi:pyruvate kinase